jgi:hypothetical protein
MTRLSRSSTFNLLSLGVMLALSACATAPAQGPTIAAPEMGKHASPPVAFAVDGAGDRIVAGNVTTPKQSYAFIAKATADNAPAWKEPKVFKGKNVRATGVAADTTGNIFVTGTFEDEVSLDGKSLKSSGTGVFLTKLSPTGDVQWLRGIASAQTVNSASVTVGGPKQNPYVSVSVAGEAHPILEPGLPPTVGGQKVPSGNLGKDGGKDLKPRVLLFAMDSGGNSNPTPLYAAGSDYCVFICCMQRPSCCNVEWDGWCWTCYISCLLGGF